MSTYQFSPGKIQRLHIRDQFILIMKELLKFYGLSKWKYKFVHILWKSFSCYFLLLSIYPTVKHAHLYQKTYTKSYSSIIHTSPKLETHRPINRWIHTVEYRYPHFVTVNYIIMLCALFYMSIIFQWKNRCRGLIYTKFQL